MGSVLVRYNKSRAFGALVLPVVAAGLFFGPDLASGFALTSNRAITADGLMLVALVWWTYSLVPGAIATIRYKTEGLSVSKKMLHLPDGRDVLASDVDRVFVRARFLRHPAVMILTAKGSYIVDTAFQAFTERRSAERVSDEILEWRRSGRIAVNGS